jgi:hypothetical protein
MPLGSTDDFTPEELALIPAPEPDELAAMEAEVSRVTGGFAPAPAAQEDQTGNTGAPPAPAEAPAAAPAADQTAASTAAAPAQQAGEAPKGDKSAALRAARHGERAAKQRAEEAEAQLAALKAERDKLLDRLPEDVRAQVDSRPMSDEEIEALQADMPDTGRVARMAKDALVRLDAMNRAQAASGTAAAPAAAAEFVPIELPPEYQDVVDSHDDLSAWHSDPDQSAYRRAVAMEPYVNSLPGWAHKPLAERLAEVARRVKADLTAASPSATPQRVDPATAIANATRVQPNTLSDIGGGGGLQQQSGDRVARYMGMSEEEVFAELARDG